MSTVTVRSAGNRARIQVYDDSTVGQVANEAAWVFGLDDEDTYTLRSEEGELLRRDDPLGEQDGEAFRLAVVE